MSQNHLVASARTTLEPTPEGARMRKRFVALSGLMLLVLGFLFAVGLGALFVLILLALAAAAGAFVLFGLARLRGDLAKGAMAPCEHSAAADESGGARSRPALSQRGSTGASFCGSGGSPPDAPRSGTPSRRRLF